MDMPGRGLYDERDSGIARSGKLMRLRSKAQIDLHLIQLSISLLMHPDFDLGSVKDSFFGGRVLRASIYQHLGSVSSVTR